jgi:tetratricopeptide (TPR) repeat protein
MLHYDCGKSYYAIGKYQDATTEFTHAITLHSMFVDAILQRARCYVQMKDTKKASANFERYLTLVEGAQEVPYPPLYKGSACYFDMPADVTYREVELVKSEMKKHRITPTIDGGGERQRNAVTASDVTSLLEKVSDALTELFCKKAANQVVVGKNPIARENGSTPTLRIASAAHESNLRSSMNSRTSTTGAKSVRFHGDPPSHAPTVRSSTALTIFHEYETRGDALEP